MMMSPMSFYEFNLKGKTAEEIMTVIRGLKKEIGHLKKVLESLDYDVFEQCDPYEHTQLSYNREYLYLAELALFEAGGEYTPSKSEQKADAFNDRIPLINKLVFGIGGFFGGYKTITVTFDGEQVRMNTKRFPGPKSEDLENDIAADTKAQFLYKLSKLNIGEWAKRYDDPDILDGAQWSFEIHYSDRKKPVKFSGSNAYPYNFGELERLFGVD